MRAELVIPDAIVEVDHAALDDFARVAHTLGIEREAAQEVLDLATEMHAAEPALVVQRAEEWRTASLRSYRPRDIDAARELAQKTLTPGQIAMLNATGLGSHPRLVGLFVNAAKRAKR